MYLGDQKLPVDVPLSRYSLTGLNRFNPKVCGLQSPCLRLTRAVTDTGSRLGMECAGSALSQWHFQPPVVRHFVAHDRANNSMSIRSILVQRLVVIIVLSLVIQNAHGSGREWEFSESDADIIKHADIYSASHLVGQLQRRVKRGTDPLKEAVPALVYRFQEIEKISREEEERLGGEAYGEFTLQILGLLSKIGDPRSKDVLIEGTKYGPKATEGLFTIGPTVIPDLLQAAGGSRIETKKGAILALRGIYELDPSFFDQGSVKQIRKKLTLLLSDEEGLVRKRAIMTLAVFGDAGSIPASGKRSRAGPFYCEPQR